MEKLAYYLAAAFLALLQSLPLPLLARLGRGGGLLAYWMDARHRRVTENNLTMCLGAEKSPNEIKALAREVFQRIGENFTCAVKTSAMSVEKLGNRLEVVGLEKMPRAPVNGRIPSMVFAIGHFGNFELFAHAVRVAGMQGATTYRALRNPALNGLLLRLRQNTGSLFFERRTEGAALRTAMQRQSLVLGLLADQHSGDHGVRIPFMGHDCNTSKAPAVFALRFGTPLFTAVCYRTKLAHWRVEVGDEIPTHQNGQPREIADIMVDVNRAFEKAVRRDPANWFWVHKRWKSSNLKPSVTEHE